MSARQDTPEKPKESLTVRYRKLLWGIRQDQAKLLRLAELAQHNIHTALKLSEEKSQSLGRHKEGPTATRLKQEAGCTIAVATATSGDCGSIERRAEDIARIRHAEAVASAKILDARYEAVGAMDLFVMKKIRPSVCISADSSILKLAIFPCVVLSTNPKKPPDVDMLHETFTASGFPEFEILEDIVPKPVEISPISIIGNSPSCAMLKSGFPHKDPHSNVSYFK